LPEAENRHIEIKPACRGSNMKVRLTLGTIALGLLLALPLRNSSSYPLGGDGTVLPPGTELDEEALSRPREVFRTEAFGGRKSYLVNLGDLAFNSPTILGGVAGKAGMSCATCHVNGTSNAKLYIPGASTRPGNVDTTSLLFNPKAFNAILDPVRIPSLRGARYLAPYGHDGRFASLRDFVRNVIVNELSGPEPAAAILDALVSYILDIDFLPNPRLDAGGRLAPQASEAERRGEALFFRPFRQQPNISCASCHVPTGAFVDHLQHDVGSGGLIKTRTLLNANFNAPYFHDGRYDSYDKVVAHFDRVFDLRLSAAEQQDLVAYLTAVGDGDRPYEHDNAASRMREITDFASVLELAISAHDAAIVSLAVAAVDAELRELAERFPDHKNTSVDGGQQERRDARMALKELVLSLRRIELAVSAGHFDDAATEYRSFSRLTFIEVPALLKKAQPWSLFNIGVHDVHYGALRQMIQSSGQSKH
jgi:Di-haem cytochrome c peroxidase